LRGKKGIRNGQKKFIETGMPKIKQDRYPACPVEVKCFYGMPKYSA
jgi:hypothetical protein